MPLESLISQIVDLEMLDKISIKEVSNKLDLCYTNLEESSIKELIELFKHQYLRHLKFAENMVSLNTNNLQCELGSEEWITYSIQLKEAVAQYQDSKNNLKQALILLKSIDKKELSIKPPRLILSEYTQQVKN